MDSKYIYWAAPIISHAEAHGQNDIQNGGHDNLQDIPANPNQVNPQFNITTSQAAMNTPFTFMNYDWYKFSKRTLFSICPCLVWNDADDIFGLPPVNAVDIPSTPILTGKKKVSNIDELQQIINQILSKPLFTKVTYCYQKDKLYTTDTVAVVIDTKHPTIHNSLKNCLDEAKQQMERGENFCIEYSFANSVKECIIGLFEPDNQRHGEGCKLSEGAEIQITNFSKPVKELLDPMCICMCFLCWIFVGPCYMIYRKTMHSVKDLNKECPQVCAKYLLGNGMVQSIQTVSTV